MKFALPLIAACVALPSYAHQVIGIADGDTLTLLVDRQPVKIRLANVDAPEKGMPYGQRSKDSLSAICWGKDATYQKQDVDRYGRVVGVVSCGGIEANREQVARGMAWVYPRYNKDASLPALQAAAKNARQGLWAEVDPTPPWEWRRSKRN